jgi:serine/threonine-protein kinase
MPLNPGTRLGSYEILGPLGAGGMGEVYRARDTKLGRDVALKVLPAAFAADPERLGRFEREARTLASLNHPHIAQVYGFEQSGEIQAIVMELVEGQTLSDLLAPGTGGMGLDVAVPIARQIADALEAAHDHGVIHRDLKPANIKVRDDGTVKVLDFGLAKALDPGGTSGADAANSPTLTARATQIGVILGTAAYMSPEQARGKSVDRRADIWAFGVVLYEMLTGKRAFEGEEISDTLASVLRQDVGWSAIPADTPGHLVHLLRRCLERDPKQRLRDIGEARIALAAGATSAGASSAGEPAAASSGAGRRFGLAHLVATGAVLLLAGAMLGWLLFRTRPTADPAAPSRVTLTVPADLSLSLITRSPLAISPDGATIVFAARKKGVEQLYLRPLGEFEPRPLAGTEGGSNPFFSPDSQWIGFFAGGKLKKVPAAGGPIVALADCVDPRGGAWVDQDTIVYVPDAATPMYRIPAGGGTPTVVVPLDAKTRERTHRWPAALPGARSVLMTVGSIEQPNDYDEGSIEVVNIETGARTPLLKARMATYSPTGHLLFTRGKLLFAVPFDVGRSALAGTPVPIAEGISGDATTGAAYYSLSDAGTMAFVPGDSMGAPRVLVWVDKTGATKAIDAPPAFYADPKVSPGGRLVAVSILEPSGARDIHLIDTERGTSTKLTFGGINRTPLWSRDGKTIYHVVYDATKNVSALWSRPSVPGGTPQRLREIPGQIYLEDISRDGSTMTMQVVSAAGGPGPTGETTRVGRLSVANPGAPEALKVTDTYWWSAISPSGQWLAHVAPDANGRLEIFVQSFTTAERIAQISTAGGTEPRWSPDGRTLYYLQDDKLIAVPIEPGPTFSFGRSQPLITGLPQWAIDSGQTYHLAPDGDRFLMMQWAAVRAGSNELRVVFNWFSDLRRAVAGAGK